MHATGRHTEPPAAHQITWFAPDRPVDGGTVYKRPAPQDTDQSADALPDGQTGD
jgi:hypothetical protein